LRWLCCFYGVNFVIAILMFDCDLITHQRSSNDHDYQHENCYQRVWRHGRFPCLRRNALYLWPFDLSGLVQIVLQLHSCPQFRAGTKGRPKAICHVRRNSRSAGYDTLQRDATNAKTSGRFRYGHIA
jgi:hypothetical protein